MRAIYTQPRTFLKYDDSHYIVYLEEEKIESYVPETADGGTTPDPVTAYAYSGTEADGGTLIEAKSPDRDSLINGIIRSRYTQSEEDAVKTHQIELLKDAAVEKASEYEAEWAEFNAVRDMAKTAVDSWLNQ